MFVCIFAQLTLNKASPAHHFSVCQHPSSPAPSSPLRCGGEERSWLPWSTAPMAVCLARCSLLLPRLLRLWGLETPRLPCQQALPCQGTAVHCSGPGSRTPWTSSTSQEPSSSLAQHRAQGTTAHGGCGEVFHEVFLRIWSQRGDTKSKKERHLPYCHTTCSPPTPGQWSANKIYI